VRCVLDQTLSVDHDIVNISHLKALVIILVAFVLELNQNEVRILDQHIATCPDFVSDVLVHVVDRGNAEVVLVVH
jgi:hypothetical protein